MHRHSAMAKQRPCSRFCNNHHDLIFDYERHPYRKYVIPHTVPARGTRSVTRSRPETPACRTQWTDINSAIRDFAGTGKPVTATMTRQARVHFRAHKHSAAVRYFKFTGLCGTPFTAGKATGQCNSARHENQRTIICVYAQVIGWHSQVDTPYEKTHGTAK